MNQTQVIENSIIKKYRKDIWRPFCKGIEEYKLIQPNEKIMVCISGGKDSFLMAKCVQELARHGRFPFEAVYVVMDPGYNDYHRQCIEDNAALLGVPVQFFNSNIFDVVASQTDGSPCYLCARMRRGYLYSYAKQLGCDKIALGHHFDDVIETTLLSMFYSAEIKTMMPKLYSDHFDGIQLIRPLYLVRESAITAWRDYHELNFIDCACRFTEGCSLLNDGTSKRREMKALIQQLKKVNPYVEDNIFRSMQNVNLECVLQTVKNGEKISFLENYDQRKELKASRRKNMERQGGKENA